MLQYRIASIACLLSTCYCLLAVRPLEVAIITGIAAVVCELKMIRMKMTGDEW